MNKTTMPNTVITTPIMYNFNTAANIQAKTIARTTITNIPSASFLTNPMMNIGEPCLKPLLTARNLIRGLSGETIKARGVRFMSAEERRAERAERARKDHVSVGKRIANMFAIPYAESFMSASWIEMQNERRAREAEEASAKKQRNRPSIFAEAKNWFGRTAKPIAIINGTIAAAAIAAIGAIETSRPAVGVAIGLGEAAAVAVTAAVAGIVQRVRQNRQEAAAGSVEASEQEPTQQAENRASQ